MRFNVLATDYDGTLAHSGQVDAATLQAIERLRASGRHAILVTGREVESLKRIFPRLDLFEMVVAENGAVLYYPVNDTVKPLHKQLPHRFVDELRHRGTPVSAGHVIVSSREPHDLVILDVIKDLGLELEIIFNKGAVMVLPSGVNKATGLDAALRELGLQRERTVAIADAENDHALLRFCGCAVAVSNALPSLKKAAHLVTRSPAGAGVVELIDRLIATDLTDVVFSPPAESGDDPNMLLPGLGVRASESP
ncbi:MAG TPA: HAD family hydrolase [Verrucomicrobiae bacterium]|nr:HAD family hydrolase [Verrucomicrobiae bacterium]